jgi:hypothetical protein
MKVASYPVAPVAEKLRGTLLDAATVTDQFEWLEGDGLFQSWNCIQFEGSPVFCAPNSKDLDQQAGWIDGFRFGVYGGITCKFPGGAEARQEQNDGASDAFDKGESIGVERALMANRFVVNLAGSGLPGEWPAPEDLTPVGGAVKPQIGIGLLEEKAGDLYVGIPTLHVPRGIAGALCGVGAAEFEGDVIRTSLGSKIAAGAGYAYPNTSPTGVAAPAGERWLYATGEVFVGQGRKEVHTVFNPDDNEIVTLVERPYVVAVDCFAVAVRVTLEV